MIDVQFEKEPVEKNKPDFVPAIKVSFAKNILSTEVLEPIFPEILFQLSPLFELRKIPLSVAIIIFEFAVIAILMLKDNPARPVFIFCHSVPPLVVRYIPPPFEEE